MHDEQESAAADSRIEETGAVDASFHDRLGEGWWKRRKNAETEPGLPQWRIAAEEWRPSATGLLHPNDERKSRTGPGKE
jgi:hypothetical protein